MSKEIPYVWFTYHESSGACQVVLPGGGARAMPGCPYIITREGRERMVCRGPYRQHWILEETDRGVGWRRLGRPDPLGTSGASLRGGKEREKGRDEGPLLCGVIHREGVTHVLGFDASFETTDYERWTRKEDPAQGAAMWYAERDGSIGDGETDDEESKPTSSGRCFPRKIPVRSYAQIAAMYGGYRRTWGTERRETLEGGWITFPIGHLSGDPLLIHRFRMDGERCTFAYGCTHCRGPREEIISIERVMKSEERTCIAYRERSGLWIVDNGYVEFEPLLAAVGRGTEPVALGRVWV